MPKAKKKLPPKDFDALLDEGDLATLQAVFDTCDVNARGGASKRTALSFDRCPDDLARWLVAPGADIGAADAYGNTALHAAADSRHALPPGCCWSTARASTR
ncbi:MAG: ankyrin repeat domain-containing protein [Burkholderia sp.]|jgi:ankyrin repeat protein|uniref:ankyrin repeat domain-containing protein n=1 Tax=Burkholderia sp. TaxID=36773 RepID=UPI00281D07F7|nr:ankyrin repeat domain-containing protein [Burkholderia sp.]MDR0242735.1 ankyrin repeat domain-containing protein [Burkholderia sp.]